MRFSTRVRYWHTSVRVCIYCFRAVCSPPGNKRPETKTRGLKNEREEQKCREERRERRRRRARIGWWRESGLRLCQMTLARTRPPCGDGPGNTYITVISFLLHGEVSYEVGMGLPRRFTEGHRSYEDEESTVSWETSAELHACAYILYFVILFQRNVSCNISGSLSEIFVGR